MNEMLEQKQIRIDMVNSIDTTFEDIYNKIKHQINDEPKKYYEQISIMQNKIRTVTDFYVRIKILEDKNKLLFSTEKLNYRKKTQLNIPNKNALGNYKKHSPSKKV